MRTGDLVAGYRAAVPHRCGVPGDLRGEPARFRGDFPDAVTGLFAEVLKLCARLGMGKLGTVALDGMKIAASASKSANRTEDTLGRLARETVAAHGAADAAAAEDELFGEGRRGMRCRLRCGARGRGLRGSVRRWPAWKRSGQKQSGRSRRGWRPTGRGGWPGSGRDGRRRRRRWLRRKRTWPGSGPPARLSWPSWKNSTRLGSPAAAAGPGSMTTAESRKPKPRWTRPGPRPPKQNARRAALRCRSGGQGPVTAISVPPLERVMAGEEEAVPGGAICDPYQVVVPSQDQ